MTDQPPTRRQRIPRSTSMKQVHGGLHQGKDIRAAREDGTWRVQARMRDVAHAIDPDRHTGLYEYHAEGAWTDIGRFGTLRLAEVALSMLKEASHLVRSAHHESIGDAAVAIPTRLVTYEEARTTLIEIGLVEDPEAYLTPGVR